MRPVRVGVLISGRGSNMVSLAEAARLPGCPYEVVTVISNRPDAGGLARAEALGLPTGVIDHKPWGKDREGFERALDAELQAANVELVALAGFMRVLTSWFVERWAGRLVNIHPSLLPLYKGLDTHARALAAGDTEAGCTVHWVAAGVDEGETIAQARVPILIGDDAVTLAARVLAAELDLYPRALAQVCEGWKLQ
jgi:formyltetrahydrofolate-dependent phosphoribosylglycinamide formyltransferase